MSKNDGGLAFPIAIDMGNGTIATHHGMDLRDFFAAKAMQAMISTAGAPCLFGLEGCEVNTAAGAYKMADAMLAERAK